MILLGRAYQNILFGNLNIFGKISYSRPSSFNTFVYQNSLFEKLFIKPEAILCDSLLDAYFLPQSFHTPYDNVVTNNRTPHPARKCPASPLCSFTQGISVDPPWFALCVVQHISFYTRGHECSVSA